MKARMAYVIKVAVNNFQADWSRCVGVKIKSQHQENNVETMKVTSLVLAQSLHLIGLHKQPLVHSP